MGEESTLEAMYGGCDKFMNVKWSSNDEEKYLGNVCRGWVTIDVCPPT